MFKSCDLILLNSQTRHLVSKGELRHPPVPSIVIWFFQNYQQLVIGWGWTTANLPWKISAGLGSTQTQGPLLHVFPLSPHFLMSSHCCAIKKRQKAPKTYLKIYIVLKALECLKPNLNNYAKSTLSLKVIYKNKNKIMKYSPLRTKREGSARNIS